MLVVGMASLSEDDEGQVWLEFYCNDVRYSIPVRDIAAATGCGGKWEHYDNKAVFRRSDGKTVAVARAERLLDGGEELVLWTVQRADLQEPAQFTSLAQAKLFVMDALEALDW